MKNLNAEQIKEDIDNCIEGECELCSYYDQTACKEHLMHGALALITSQEQRIKKLGEENVSKWIPIESNEKPQHLKNYFIAYVFGDSDMRFYGEAKYHAYGGNGIVDGAHFSNEGVDDMRVTHWMPIPKLP